MTKDDLEKDAQTYILCCHNLEQDEIFKSGGIPLPKFSSFEDMKKFFDIMKDLFPPATSRLEDVSPGEIVFDIPDRYK